MRKPEFIFGLCVSAAALLAAVPAQLLAAEIPTVLVTAQKRSQSLQDVSAAVTAVSADRLDSARINNIEDLQLIVPSIYMGNDFYMAKTFIRGVGANTSTTGSETGVALHVDGAFVARAEAQRTSIFDLERVEVLRGPQGTLYGRNAVGGSINLITAKPTRELEGYLNAGIGSYGAIDASGALSGPITENLLARVAFKSESRGGFGVNPATGNDVDDLNRQMARGHLWLIANDSLDILLTGEYYTQRDASSALKFRSEAFPDAPNRLFAIGRPSAGVIGGFAVNPRDLASESDPKTETDTWAATATTTFRLNDNIALVNVTNYRALRGFINQDLDLSSVVNGASTTGQNSSVQRRDINSMHYSTEQQLKFSSNRLNGVLGFFYFNETQEPYDTVGFGPINGEANILPGLANPSTRAGGPFTTGLQIDGVNVGAPTNMTAIPLGEAHTLCNSFYYIGGGVNSATLPPPKRVCIATHLETDAWAIFGQGNLKLTDQLAIKLGARYSSETVGASSASIIVASNGGGAILRTTHDGNFNERSFTDFSPEAGIEFSPTSDLLVYYTYSQAFKAGAGENNQGPGATAPVPNRSIIVSPEEIENHEFGIKSAWFDNRLILNLSGYFYDLEGQQINKTITGGPAGFSTIFENAAQTSAHGAEVEFTGYLSDDFRVSGSLSWLDSKYQDFLTVDPLVPQNIVPPGPPICPLPDPGITWPSNCSAIGGFVADPNAGNIQLAGNPTRNSPEISANLHAEYDIHLPNLPGQGYLTLGGDMTYRSEVYFTEFNRLIEGQEAVTLFDFNLRYTSGDGRLHANAWVKNATDELVAASTFQLSTGRAIGVTYLPPRTYGFSVGYSF